MNNPNIGIANQSLKSVVDLLNSLLADEFVLYVKTRNYHWNVTGPHFHDLHKLFEAQYEELDDIVDEVAERVRSLGGVSSGSMTEFVKQARLKEKPGQLSPSQTMIRDLLEDHEADIKTLRQDLDA